MHLQWTVDHILPRAVGATGLAAATSYLNHATNQLTTLLRNGDLLAWLVVLADLFNVAPDGTPAGYALDAAADGAIYALADALFTSRFELAQILPLEAAGVVATAVPSATPAPAPSTATSSTPAGVTTTPVPAASMSAVGDVATAGY